MNPVRWETKGGHVRWQPRRYDGRVLVYGCAMGGCVIYWYDHEAAISEGRSPRAFWFRWVAVLRGRIGDFWERRRLNKQWVPTEGSEE